MAVVSTGLVGQLTEGVRSEFFNAFNATPTRYADWSTRIESTGEQNNYRWLGTVPNMRLWGTGRLAKGLRDESYDVRNLKYEATIAVSRDEISDDNTGQINVRVNELAQRAATHKDYLLAQLLINGGTSGYNSYDGVSFFNDAHVSGASGSQDNNLTFDADATPTTAQFKSAFQNAVQSMLGFKDDQGEPMMISQGGLVVVVPPALYFQAAEAMQATVISNTSNVIAGMASVVVFPWLTEALTWYLLKTDTVVRPFVFQDREPIEFTSVTDPEDSDVFTREEYLYGVRARYAMAYGYWQYAVKTLFN